MSKLTDFKEYAVGHEKEIRAAASGEFHKVEARIVDVMMKSKEVMLSMMEDNGETIFLMNPNINLEDFKVAMTLMKACTAHTIYNLYKAGLIELKGEFKKEVKK